jgi:CO/xanthine dehydrogenase FAD-binding subunit
MAGNRCRCDAYANICCGHCGGGRRGNAVKPFAFHRAASVEADAAFHVAAQHALAGAQPLQQNAFKVDLAKHGVVRALTAAAAPH